VSVGYIVRSDIVATINASLKNIFEIGCQLMSQQTYEWKNPEWLFNKVTGYIFGVILLFTTLALLVGSFRLFYSLYELVLTSGVTGNYMKIFSDVLTLVILLELSRALFQYFMENTVRLPVIFDAGIVFVLRDIMIGLFEHKLKTQDLYALTGLLLVLGLLRIGFGFYYDKKQEIPKVD